MRSRWPASRAGPRLSVKFDLAFGCRRSESRFQELLARWRENHPGINLRVAELADRDIAIALEERRLDVAFVPSFTLWPHAAALQIYREQIVAALPAGHCLARRKTLRWTALREETILVQGWDESQAQREFFASLLGSGVRFQTHGASKQSVLALVKAGFGITLAAKSQSEVKFPGVVFRSIAEPNAWFRVDLAWMPEAEEPVVGRFVAFMRDEFEVTLSSLKQPVFLLSQTHDRWP